MDEEETLERDHLKRGDAITPAPPAPEAVADGRVFLGTGFFWGLVAGILVAAAIIVLAAQNTASASVHFLGWTIETPLIVLILGSVLAGIILDEVVGLFYRRRRRRMLNEREELKRLRGEQES